MISWVLNASMLLPCLALILVIILAIYLIISGLFRTIDVDTKSPPYGEMTIAYKTGKGAYKDCYSIHAEAETICPGKPHIGLFYDDPESVPEPDLRYAVGLILTSDDKDPDPQDLEKILESGYKVAVLPKQQFAVVSSFPIKTSLSLYVAIFRVYPRIRNYINSNGLCAYPAIEICDKNLMHFLMPLSKQEEFFVPEFSEEQVSIATTDVSNHPDHAAVDAMLRTSSRNSARKSEERRQSVESFEGGASESVEECGHGDGVFVKPTKPAPKKVVKTPKLQETVPEADEMSSSSSFEDLKLEEDSEDESK